jgi:uncharacterized protein (TIGR02186 family)
VIRAALLLLLMALPVRAEQIVAGLSQSEVSITANFSGSEILIYGAVKRDAPAPKKPRMEVIVTVEGPSSPLIIRKKERRAGIWVNASSVQIDLAPSFYAVATTGPIADILTDSENLRYQVTIPRAIRAAGLDQSSQSASDYIAALLRIRESEGRYRLDEGAVELAEATLFRADVVLPANLTEGDYRVRMYITRGGIVVDTQDQVILVQKQGIERFVNRLSKSQPLIYGLMSLVLAVAAGWGASTAFRLMRA